MIHRLIEAFFTISGSWAIGAVFLFAAAETALFIGFLIPGELIVILGGVLASRGHVPLVGILAASVAGPILGDSIGYYLGRRYGDNVSHKRLRKRWARAQSWIRRKGAPAVAFGRFAAFLRTVVPAAAGAAKMPYRRFLPWNVAAGVVWGAGSALAGYFAGAHYEAVIRWMGRAGLILLGAAVLLAGGFFLWRKFTRRTKE